MSSKPTPTLLFFVMIGFSKPSFEIDPQTKWLAISVCSLLFPGVLCQSKDIPEPRFHTLKKIFYEKELFTTVLD